MPNILITESEQNKVTSFDITDNTVLVPMICARKKINDTDYEQAATVKEFNNYADFQTWAAEKYIYREVKEIEGAIEGTVEYVGLPDKTYIMIYELLLSGLKVVVAPINVLADQYDSHGYCTLDEGDVVTKLEDWIEAKGLVEFENKNLYNIKFITSGAYANVGKKSSSEESADHTIGAKLAALAAKRGDAVALLELRENFTNKDGDETDETIVEELSDLALADDYYSYAALSFPWYTCTVSAVNKYNELTMPSCFGYLKAYAKSVRTNANWFAAAGVQRGEIPGLIAPLYEVGESLMHTLQGDGQGEVSGLSIKVNPIYNAGVYKHRIWGNRVVANNLINTQYRDFLNVRLLICDIKKQVYHAAIRTTFEPNDDIVWLNFKSYANSLLDKMKSGRGIDRYKWEKVKSDKLATIEAKLYVRPIEAVETIEINLVLAQDEADINEGK